MVIPSIVRAHEKISEDLKRMLEELEIGGRAESMQMQHCWGWPEYWEQSWRPDETFYHSDSNKIASANAGVKTRNNNNNNNNLNINGNDSYYYYL